MLKSPPTPAVRSAFGTQKTPLERYWFSMQKNGELSQMRPEKDSLIFRNLPRYVRKLETAVSRVLCQDEIQRRICSASRE